MKKLTSTEFVVIKRLLKQYGKDTTLKSLLKDDNLEISEVKFKTRTTCHDGYECSGE